MKVFLGADHRGFKLKELLKPWMISQGYDVADVGALKLDPDDDYPIIAEKLGKAVAKIAGSLSVLLCGSGVGASAAVNKIDGIRGSIGISVSQVRAGRHDDDMNVLVLAADAVSFKQAQTMVRTFLSTPFVKTPRYQRRLREIRLLEKEN